MPEISFLPIGLDRLRLTALMQARGLDGVFFSSPENVFYTTGYPCLPGSGNPIIYALRNQLPFFSYAGSDGGLSLLCWAQAAMGIEYGTEDVRSFFTYDMALGEMTAFVQEKLKPGCTLGVDSTFPYFFLQLIQENVKPVNIVIVDDLIHDLQLVKSAAEIERIRRHEDDVLAYATRRISALKGVRVIENHLHIAETGPAPKICASTAGSEDSWME